MGVENLELSVILKVCFGKIIKNVSIPILWNLLKKMIIQWSQIMEFLLISWNSRENC